MSGIRPFREGDIPAVAELRRRCFGATTHAAPEALEAYFAEIFFRGPWRHDDLPSLVYEQPRHGIVGFLGVLARPMLVDGGRIWMAVPTQLMAAPETRGAIGMQLMKAFLRGPQDLSMADACNDPAREIWERLGARVAPVYSLFWSLPLRPVNLVLRQRASRPARVLLRPLALLTDAVLERLPLNKSDASISCTALEASSLLECHASLPRSCRLRPDYDLQSLSWMLARLERLSGFDGIRGAVLRNGQGAGIGWYLYATGRTGTAQVIQLGGQPAFINTVLSALVRDVKGRGDELLHGRLQPQHLDALAGSPLQVSRGTPGGRGPWMIVHSRSENLMNEILSGGAWFTRLEGEWWVDF